MKININNSSKRNATNANHTSHLENINAKPLAFFFSIAAIHAFTLLSNSHEASWSFLFTVPLPTHKPSFWSLEKPWHNKMLMEWERERKIKCKILCQQHHGLNSLLKAFIGCMRWIWSHTVVYVTPWSVSTSSFCAKKNYNIL